MRDLHAFPTRRSSDLHRLSVYTASSKGPRTKRLMFGSCDRLPLCHQSPVLLAAKRCSIPVETRFTSEADRKSTRLNSSHLVISYAVFCLKKKKYSLLR